MNTHGVDVVEGRSKGSRCRGSNLHKHMDNRYYSKFVQSLVRKWSDINRVKSEDGLA